MAKLGIVASTAE